MKTKLFLFLLICFVFAGCDKKNEPTQISISEDLLKSYFPYQNGDRLTFFNDLMGNVNYTVLESSFRKEEGKMIVTVNMTGANYKGEQLYFILLDAVVENEHVLTINYRQSLQESSQTNSLLSANAVSNSTNGSFTYDAETGSELPKTITLSDGSIIKQNEGLTYFIDYDSEKWYFKKRL